eukprot:6634828-Prymnesium_polylepis.1
MVETLQCPERKGMHGVSNTSGVHGYWGCALVDAGVAFARGDRGAATIGCETGVTLRHRGPDSRRTGLVDVVYALEHVYAVEHDACALGGPCCAA